MIMPTDLIEGPFFDEERGYLHAAIADLYFARSMLRRVGTPERERFSRVGFAYGDATYYGYGAYEVHDEQLSNVLYTLFGEGFAGEFFSLPYYEDDEQEETLQQIAALDGGPLQLEYPHYHYGGDYEEVLITEIRAYATGPPGTGPTARQRMGALVGAMRTSRGEAAAPKLHRWREYSERSRQLRESHFPAEHVLLVSGCEPCALQEMMHEDLFERLIRTWRHMPRDLAGNSTTTQATDKQCLSEEPSPSSNATSRRK